VLVTIVMTIMLIRTLGQASQGSVNPSEVSLIMGYTMLGHLPTVLTMSLFIASVGTLSRNFLESEMVIWLVSGKGLRSFLTPMLRFAWPMLLCWCCWYGLGPTNKSANSKNALNAVAT
jgi:lipopolysaccharide export system permease protein